MTDPPANHGELLKALREAAGPRQKPLLERLELNRAGHFETSRRRREQLEELRAREQHSDELLRRLAGSRTLRLAGLLSRLRGRGRLTFSADRIRRVLGD